MNKKIFRGPKGGLYTLSKNGKKQYINSDNFCGSSGGSAPGTFPVNTQKRCRAALSYSRFAPSPCGIAKCALAKAKKHGWSCGISSKRVQKCSRGY